MRASGERAEPRGLGVEVGREAGLGFCEAVRHAPKRANPFGRAGEAQFRVDGAGRFPMGK